MSPQQPFTDIFAQTAKKRLGQWKTQLIEPKPPRLPQRILNHGPSNQTAIFQPGDKLDSPEKLERELIRQRRRYAPYLQHFAPKLKSSRIVLPLTEFDWREQTPADQRDFQHTLAGKGKWKTVTIPHYGGPLGRAVTYYRTTFTLTQAMLKKPSLYIRFGAVDYKTHVFINNNFLGSHEGFFSPFEFEFSSHARLGKNTLVVKVENDAVNLGDSFVITKTGDTKFFEGDKIYASTGPGWDDPDIGWHHCPPGMGIYQDVRIEAREDLNLHDIFIRPIPKENRAEAWIEIFNPTPENQTVWIELSVFGRNFKTTVFKNRRYHPQSFINRSMTDVPINAPAHYMQPVDMGPGVNYLRIGFDMKNARLWQPDRPWLYQAHVKLYNEKDRLLDAAERQFGMRSFRMDENSKPKGKLFFNDVPIRLRGANTMGHLQQCVMKRNYKQLIDDILLLKICNLNFLRLTQRPVQPEIYDYCDRLGMMTQSDLPLFGVIRRNQFAETLRQAEEMERLIRCHPCNIMVSYINEPFPNANNRPHRHFTHEELDEWFAAADHAVHLHNPDRVIKPVDGIYDPPTPGLPDNHCYCGWYNQHALDIGKLHKGCWQPVKPGWLYACGEYGAEGLEDARTMRKYYPADWLPQNLNEEKAWTPDRIVKSQAGPFHYMWHDSGSSLKEWITLSQKHQAWVVRLMTEAFRRDNSMVSTAVHLGIDAFPSGWMKTIMDVDRRPKKAYFAYRDALSPLLANLRSDRFSFFSGESINIEAWICNDQNDIPQNAYLHYQYELDGKVIRAGRTPAAIKSNAAQFQGFLRMAAPDVENCDVMTLRLGLLDRNGKVFHDTAIDLNIFPAPEQLTSPVVRLLGRRSGPAARLAKDLNLKITSNTSFQSHDVILMDDPKIFARHRTAILKAVKAGAQVILLQWPEGQYRIAGSPVDIQLCGMGNYHFISRKTGHPMVKGLNPDDFKFWYDPQEDRVTPILETTFQAPDWTPILRSGNSAWGGMPCGPALAAAELTLGKGKICLCQLLLAGRVKHNPPGWIFAQRLMGMKT